MSDARRLATGSIAQQAAQVTGLLTMFAIVAVLARELSLAELGAFGLLNGLAGYLLIVQNAAASAAVRTMAAAPGDDEGTTALSTSAAMYVLAGAAAGVTLIALGVALASALDLSADVERQVRLGALAVGTVTFVGWPVTVYRDALRARGRFVLAARMEIFALLLYATLVLGLAFADAPFWTVLGASATIPLLAGLLCALAAKATRLPWRLRAGAVDRGIGREMLGLGAYVSLAEAASAAVYVLTRMILGVFKSSATVGLYEGPIRAHNLIRALNAAVTVTVLPTAVRYRAEGDDRRLAELLIRGSRYSLALIVPLAVTGMVLAGPLLAVAFGEKFRDADAAMAILLAHWLLNGIAGVAAAMLIAADRAGDVARWALIVAVPSVLLALAFASPLGLDGVAIASTLSYVVAFPYLLTAVLKCTTAEAGDLARRAFLPAWTTGLGLGLLLVALRAALEPEGAAAIGAAIAGVAAYWLAYYLLWLDSSERALAKSILRRAPAGAPAS
jgi:O-antigen/teichoic acid export membrane protein